MQYKWTCLGLIVTQRKTFCFAQKSKTYSMGVSVKYCQSQIHKAHMCWVGTPLAIAQILYTCSKNLFFAAFGWLRFDMNRTAKHRETKMETWARTCRITVAFHLTDVKCHCCFLSLEKKLLYLLEAFCKRSSSNFDIQHRPICSSFLSRTDHNSGWFRQQSVLLPPSR